jgi:hypothetical protein
MDKTAHATENGLLILCGPASDRRAVLVSNGKAVILDNKKYETLTSTIGSSMNKSMDISEEQDLAEEIGHIPNEIRDILENANYPGRLSSIQELKSADVSYSIGDDSDPVGEVTKSFNMEKLSWSDQQGQIVTVEVEGELLGRLELGTNSPAQDLLEPLTLGEAMTLIKTFFPSEEVLSRDVAARSVESYLLPNIQAIKEVIEASIESCEADGRARFSDLASLFPKSFDDKPGEGWEFLWARIKASVKNRSIGQPWSYQDTYSMGERHGVTDIMTELVVQGKSASELMEPDDLHEKEEQARATSLYKEFYDLHGINRGWPDRSLYYARCKEKKQWLYEKLRDTLLKKPRSNLKVYLTDDSPIRKAYKNSVKACSPGPLKKLVDNKWVNLPLTGPEARKVLLSKGFNAEQLTEKSTFFRGEHWHKLLLTKELLDKLEQDIRNYINEVPSIGTVLPAEAVTITVTQERVSLKVTEKR